MSVRYQYIVTIYLFVYHFPLRMDDNWLYIYRCSIKKENRNDPVFLLVVRLVVFYKRISDFSQQYKLFIFFLFFDKSVFSQLIDDFDEYEDCSCNDQEVDDCLNEYTVSDAHVYPVGSKISISENQCDSRHDDVFNQGFDNFTEGCTDNDCYI